MATEIIHRLDAAIREADEKYRAHMRKAQAVNAEAAEAFKPVAEAAGQISEHVQSITSLEFTINADSVCVRLADQELWLTYDPSAKKFIGEESAHSWYDGERYAQRYKWSTANECTDAMIRLCAQYVRMARAIDESTARDRSRESIAQATFDVSHEDGQ